MQDNNTQSWTAAVLFSALLFLPGFIWIIFDKGLWRADPVGYALDSISLYNSLTTDVSLWKWQLFTGYKAPLLWWLGQVMVPIGCSIGAIDISLLLIPSGAVLISLLLIFRIIEICYGSWSIALCGSLMVAASPLFSGLSTAFWVEPVQVAVISWFIYALVNAGKWNIIFSLAQFVVASSIALMIKFSTPLYIVGPTVFFWWKVLSEKSVWRVDLKSVLFLLFAVAVALPAALFYYKNINAMREFAQFAATNSLFASNVSKGELWDRYITTGIFRPFSYYVFLGVVLLGIIMTSFRSRYAHLKLAAVALFQIALFLLLWMLSENADPRYFLPATPYFVILFCWGLKAISFRVITAAALCIFLVQFINVTGFAFGVNEMHVPYGLIRPIICYEENSKSILRDIIPLVRRDSSVIFDLSPELGVAEFKYELAKQDVRGNWASSAIDVSTFFHYNNQRIDVTALDEEKIWLEVMDYKPDFYITWKSRLNSDNVQPEMQRIDRYTAVTVSIRWAIAKKIEDSGQYEMIPFDNHPELLIYQRCGLHKADIRNDYSTQ